MESMTRTAGTYRPVGFIGAVAEQVRFLWASRRPIMMLVALVGVLALSGEPWSDPSFARLFALWPLYIVGLAPVWAFAVWHNEGPSSRLYFWSHPVSRAFQALARVSAGAIWLLLMYAALLMAGALFAFFDGNLWQLSAVGLPGWVAFFTGPLLMYLAISLLTVPSDYPIRWFLGLLFGIPIVLSMLTDRLGYTGIVETLMKPFSAEWGFGPAILGPVVIAMERIESMVRGGSGEAVNAMNHVDIGTWWITMPLWMILLACGVCALASRHPDRLPRLRRGD